MTEYRQALPANYVLNKTLRIEGVLGQGGFGITYRATDINLNDLVAIKEYFPASLAMRDGGRSVHAQSSRADGDYESGRQRFMREMQALNKFRHSNILRVRSIFDENNTVYAVLDYEDGATLGSWGNSLEEAPNQKQIDKLLIPLLAALESVHGKGIMHRDISPDNIMVRNDGSPVLIDFGSARLFTSGSNLTSSVIIKHGFSPPEQYQSSSPERQGPPTDIYALAATLYYLVTANAPHKAEARLEASLNKLPDPLPAVDTLALRSDYHPSFLEGITWGLKLRESDRPQSIAEWRAILLNRALNKTAAGSNIPTATQRGIDDDPPELPPPDARPTSHPPRNGSPPSSPNGLTLRLIGGVVLLACALMLAYLAFQEVPPSGAQKSDAAIIASEPASNGSSNDDALARSQQEEQQRAADAERRKKQEAAEAERREKEEADAAERKRTEEAARIAEEEAKKKTAARKFKIYAHLSIEGGDIYSTWPEIPLKECREACRETPECVAYTHDLWSKKCFLKNSMPLARDDGKYQTGVIDGIEIQTLSSEATKMSRKPGGTFDGQKPLKRVKARDYDECKEVCLALPGECWFVEYDSLKAPSCAIFKDTPEEYTTVPGGTSDVGVKFQEVP